MASKRTLNDADDSLVDFEDLIEKKTCTEPEIKKPRNVIFQLLPLIPGKPLIIEPTTLSSNNYEEPCSSTATVPSDTRLAASLTSELDLGVKSELTDEEQDIHFDDSISDVKEEPIQEEGNVGDEENSEEKEEEMEGETEDENTKKNTEKWTQNSSSMKSFVYTKEQNFKVPTSKHPYELFSLIFDDDLLDLIIKETNKTGSKAEKTWVPISRAEITIFIGLLIHTGTISLQRLSDYWSFHYLFNIKSFSRFMKRQRFLQLLDYLSFSSATGPDNIKKIQPVIDHFNKRMDDIYNPGANLIVTNSITIHTGNILTNEENRRKRMVPNKVTRIHILAEPTGIVLKVNATQGNVKYDTVVFDLLSGKLDCGHSVYLTERYNSYQTTFKLLGRKTHCTGPLEDHFTQRMQPSLRIMVSPDDLYNKNGSYYCDGIHLCRREKQFYLSSQYDEELLHVPTPRGRVSMKPKLIAMYDSVMDLDLDEHLMSFYPCRENSLSWHKKVFIHIIQLAIVNAFNFHEQSNRFYNFRLDILEKLLPADASHSDGEGPHVMTKIKKVKTRERRVRHGEIVVSKEVVRKECRGCRMEQRNKRTSTIYECRQCEGAPGYCEPCFERVHRNMD